MTNASEKPTNQPIFRKKLPGGISSAVFQNTRDGKTYRSINIQRSFKQNGKWEQRSIYLDYTDIPVMIEALQATWRFFNEFPIGGNSPAEESQDANDESSDIAA